jgi:hypothetical protein
MRSTEYMKHLSGEIPRNNPLLDSMMFVRHNAGSFQEPGDFQFEPSPVWLDDNSIAVDESATVFLRNVLTKSKSSLGDYRRELEKKRKEVENAKTVRQNIRDGKDKRDEVDVVRAVFAVQEAMHEVERQKVNAEVEVSTITSVVGDLSIGARNHNFKGQTFKIPTNCDLCGDRIWGLSAKGYDCRDCGYTCHSKCEMKVPADCPGEQSKEERKKLKEERQKAAHTVTASTNGAATTANGPSLTRSDTVNSMNTLSSGYSATAHRSISGGMSPTAEETPPPVAEKKVAPAPGARRNRIVAPPPAQYVKNDDMGDIAPPTPTKSSEPRGRMLYAYQENGEGEVTVADGVDVVIVEPDGMSSLFLSPWAMLTHHNRLIRLDENPRRPLLRPRTHRLRRPHSLPSHNLLFHLPRPSRLHILRLLRLSHLHQHSHNNNEKERPSRSPQARRKETALRRSFIRLYGAIRRRTQHGRGRQIRADQYGGWGGVGGCREGRGRAQCAGELCEAGVDYLSWGCEGDELLLMGLGGKEWGCWYG